MNNPAQEILLEVNGVRLNDEAPEISFALLEGDALAVTGANGTGKSLLLSVILGQHHASGSILIFGRRVEPRQGRKKFLEGVGLLLQGNGLLRDLTVRENVALPGRVRGEFHLQEIEREVEMLLRLTGCANLGSVFPSQLSGGEARRVALARALAGGSRLLLLDEPMAGLTAAVRQELIELLMTLRRHKVLQGLVVFTEDTDLARRLTDYSLELKTNDSTFGIPGALVPHENPSKEKPL